jgi:RNA polymerase sigma-70 factor (ECF subfamily)
MEEPYKEVFNLRVFGELSYEKIGMLFGKSSGWARVTFYRAKKKIEEYMEGQKYE